MEGFAPVFKLIMANTSYWKYFNTAMSRNFSMNNSESKTAI